MGGEWDAICQQLYTDTVEFSSDDTVRGMLTPADRWNRVAYYVRVLLVAKEIELDRFSN